MKREKRKAGRLIRKGFMVAAIVITLLTGMSMSVSAGWFWTDPETSCVRYQKNDGSFSENEWVQLTVLVNQGRWVYVGPEGYVAGGETSSTRGGYTPHAWCQLDGADGTIYIFEPHIDYLLALRSGKAVSYVRFGVPSTKVAGKYVGIDRIFDKVK